MSVIIGCGDVGRRIARMLDEAGFPLDQIFGLVNSSASAQACSVLGITAQRFDLDALQSDLQQCDQAEIYYTVAPQKTGLKDQRTQALLEHFSAKKITPSKAVVISTTGVYGDCGGQWVDELSPTQPLTERGQRRLDLEQQWLAWGDAANVPIVILRVPGIYANSRLPVERIKKRTPVVAAKECGFTNRIHADDLAEIAVSAMRLAKSGEIFNVTDGTPGKISEYLQAVAKVLGEEPLPEISMAEAQTQLSEGMLSYLSESRKISNKKMLNELKIVLRYPDFRQGIKF